MFHTATLGGLNYTDDELVLANTMVKYWTSFAHTGDPNPSSGSNQLLYWPQYRVDPNTGVKNTSYMRFKTPKNEVSLLMHKGMT